MHEEMKIHLKAMHDLKNYIKNMPLDKLDKEKLSSFAEKELSYMEYRFSKEIGEKELDKFKKGIK